MQSYEELLKKVYCALPKVAPSRERFVLPSINVMSLGNRTMIRNFTDIAAVLRREPRHLLKFLSHETAAPASIDGGRALFQAKIPLRTLTTKLEAYIKEFVLCRECGRPDTRLERVNRITLLVCEACGARSSVR